MSRLLLFALAALLPVAVMLVWTARARPPKTFGHIVVVMIAKFYVAIALLFVALTVAILAYLILVPGPGSVWNG